MTIQKLVEALIKSIQEKPEKWQRTNCYFESDDIQIWVANEARHVDISLKDKFQIPHESIPMGLKEKLYETCKNHKGSLEKISKLIP